MFERILSRADTCLSGYYSFLKNVLSIRKHCDKASSWSGRPKQFKNQFDIRATQVQNRTTLKQEAMRCEHDAPRLIDFVFFFVAFILVQVLQLLHLVLYPGDFDTIFAVNFFTLSSLLVAFIALFYFCLRGCPSPSQTN